MEIINYFRSAVFYLGYIAGLFMVLLIAIPICLFLGFDKRYYCLSRGNAFVVWWARLICGIRYEVEGMANVPDKACVVASNHQSAWETYFLGLLFVPQATVLKVELTRIPVFGWALRLAAPIAIDRSKPALALKQMLSQGKKRLLDGIWVMIYPEGTRVRPGKQGQFNKGAALLASKAGVPLLPVAHNAGSVWPAGQFIKRPGVVRVVVGQPILTKDKDRDSIHQEMESWIRDTASDLRLQ